MNRENPKGTLPRVTPTSVSDLDCPARFWTLRVLKEWPPHPPITAVEFGTGVHDVLKNVFDPRNRTGDGSAPNLEHLDALTRQAFYARRYPSTEARQEDMERGAAMVRGYAAQDDDAEWTIAVERQGEFPFPCLGPPLFMLWAKLDRVLVRGDQPTRLVVRDYKTNAQPRVDLMGAFVQLWVAKLLYPGYASYALELDGIDGDGRVDRTVVEGTALKGMYGLLIAKATRVLVAADHPAEAGEGCQFCPLRARCPQSGVNFHPGDGGADQALPGARRHT